MDVNNRPAVVFQYSRFKIDARGKHGGIGDGADDILHHVPCGVLRHADNRSVILDSQEDIAAKTIQK